MSIKKTVFKLKTNINLPTYMVDGMVIHSREDGMYLIRLTTSLPEPEGNLEQFRFMVTDKSLKNIVDAICSNTGYYPKKTQKKKITTIELA